LQRKKGFPQRRFEVKVPTFPTKYLGKEGAEGHFFVKNFRK